MGRLAGRKRGYARLARVLMRAGRALAVPELPTGGTPAFRDDSDAAPIGYHNQRHRASACDIRRDRSPLSVHHPSLQDRFGLTQDSRYRKHRETHGRSRMEKDM